MPEKEYNINQQLLEQLKAGSLSAFTHLYKQYSGDLYLALTRLVKSETDAEEILQDIFLNFWEKRENISIHYSVKAYLYRIAENKACDFFRRLKRDRKLYDSIKQTSASLYMKDEFIGEEEYTLLEEAMDILPPQRKKVFYLCKMEGLSYQEVSSLLGISTSTINDHIVKATQAVREFVLLHSEIKTATLIVLFAISSATIF